MALPCHHHEVLMPVRINPRFFTLLLATPPLTGQASDRCGPSSDTIPAAVWSAEFAALRDTIELRHADAFRWTSREQLAALAGSVHQLMPRQSPRDRVLSWARWVTAVGDGHTRLLPFAQSDSAATRFDCRYPIEVSLFDDGIFVTAAADSLRHLLGAQVTNVGPLQADRLLDRLGEVVPHDNRHGVLRLVPPYLSSPPVMQFLGIANDAGLAPWTFRNADGSTRILTLGPSDEPLHQMMMSTGDREIRGFFRNDPMFSAVVLGDSAMVVQLNQMSHTPDMRLDSAAAQMLRDLDRSRARRVILDVRYNGGGSAELLRPFIAELASRQHAGRLDVVAVLVGRGTFSAAVWNTLDLIRATGAVVVGQPSAGRPNGFGETRWVTLPRTGLRFSYSTRWNQRSSADDVREAVLPDIITSLRFGDVHRGVDVALDAALALRSMPGR